MPGVIFVNPGSGKDDTSIEGLREHFPGHRVEECPPADLAARIRAAIADGTSFVGIAGGDGTVRSAAQELVGSSIPLLVVPEGTRNHFARDIGIASLDDAAASASGQPIAVDVGMVNGHYFVNNSSIGIYPKIVVRREFHQRRLRKGVANVVAGWEQLRHGRRIVVEVDGTPHAAWLVFVGNGIYGEGLLDLTDRESVDGNQLDLRVVRADRPLARFRVVAAVLLGRLARSPLVVRQKCRSATVDLPSHEVDVALDGEVERMSTPLHFESCPACLQVLVPLNHQKDV